MAFKITVAALLLLMSASAIPANAQQATSYNLVELLQKNGLEINTTTQTHVTDSTKMPAISTLGIVLLKGVTFESGTIDVDLRGKDVFLKSFLGIAFRAKDTLNYDVIYFRPFRFHSTDTATRRWSVQYMAMPGFDYEKLRKEHPLVYENQVNPVPDANDWFHATIVVKDDWITVYVNHSAVPSLKIKSLNNNPGKRIALWTSGIKGDFANLVISNSTW